MGHKEYSCTVIWSDADQEYVGFCGEFPSLSWLAATKESALAGIKNIVADVLADMEKNGESLPNRAQETLYLLSNPANTGHLRKSINDLENGLGIPVSLDDL